MNYEPKFFFAAVFIILGVSGCIKGEPKSEAGLTESGYFSIIQYTDDHFKNYLGTPIVFTKFTNLNGQKDSGFVAYDKVDWNSIFKTFFETDISDPKFADLYQVDMFTDPTTYSRVFYYQAKDKKLFTQTIQVRVEPEYGQVQSIYIEAVQNSFWKKKKKRMMYVPMEVIHIQDQEEPLIGEKIDLTIDYKFYN